MLFTEKLGNTEKSSREKSLEGKPVRRGSLREASTPHSIVSIDGLCSSHPVLETACDSVQ